MRETFDGGGHDGCLGCLGGGVDGGLGTNGFFWAASAAGSGATVAVAASAALAAPRRHGALSHAGWRPLGGRGGVKGAGIRPPLLAAAAAAAAAAASDAAAACGC